MYKVTTKTENGERTEFLQGWKDVLLEGFVGGFWFTVCGLIALVATPFIAGYAAYHQWKHGGVEVSDSAYTEHFTTTLRSSEERPPS